MKRALLAFTLLTSLTFGALAQASKTTRIRDKDVPQAVINTFNSRFPKATEAEWKKKGNEYNVSFELNRIDHHATFSSSGALQEHGKEFSSSMIPAVIREAVTRDYPQHRIDDVQTAIRNKATNYEVSLDGRPDLKVLYSASGKLLKKEVDN